MTQIEILEQIAESLQCITFLLLALTFMYFVGWNKK